MKKTELLDWLQEEYQKFEVFLDQIGEALMEQPGVAGDWSMKDIVAHLTGWNRWLVIRLEAAQRGEPEPASPWPANVQEEDEINAWIYESSRESSLRKILDDMQQVHQQLLAFVEGLSDDVRIERDWRLVWFGDQRFPAGEFFDHFHDDHEPDIRAWLARQDYSVSNS